MSYSSYNNIIADTDFTTSTIKAIVCERLQSVFNKWDLDTGETAATIT